MLSYQNVVNPIQSVSDIVERMSVAPGINKNTKNFKKVIDAVVSGYSVIDILEDPIGLADVAASQAHYFKKFLNTVSIPKKLRRIKQTRVLVAQSSLDTIDDDLRSMRDYSDFFVGEDKVSGYKEISSSYAIEQLAPLFVEAPKMVTTKKRIGKEVIERDVYAYIVPHIFFLDLFDSATNEDEQKRLLEKKQRLVKEGMKYIDHEGKERVAKFLMQSPSQERVVSGVFIAEHVIHPIDALNRIGMNPFAFAKALDTNSKGETVYKLDYAKAMKRFGLTLSNSVKSRFIQIGTEVVRDETTGDVIIKGGNVTIRVVEDAYSTVNQDKFKAFGKDTKRGQIFDAADHPVEQVAGDGQMYMNERVKNIAEKEFGRSFQNGVVRLFSGFVKGNAVYIPGLNNYFEEDMVIPMSSFKASTDTLEDVLDELDLQFRVALFGTPLRMKKQFVRIPYQFVHGMNLSAKSMIQLVEPHLDRVAKMLKDPELIKEYVGIDKLDSVKFQELSREEQEVDLENTLVSTLTTFLYYAPESYVDVYLKEKALVLLQELIKDWKAGSIPVEGNYRFLIQDPYTILETYKARGTKKEIRKDGKLYVDPNMGMKANTVFMFDRDGKTVHVGDVAIARNPQMTKGQSRVVEARAYAKYMNTKDAFDGIIMMSCHDFNAIAMGGADMDGDTALVMTETPIVEAVRKACANAPAFLDVHFEETADGEVIFADGCPYTGDANKMKKHVYTFTKEEYTRDLQMTMYENSLEYVAEKLVPNRIGELTNYATKLADAVRVMGYKMLEATNQEEYDYLKGRIQSFEEMIDLLGWVQSWEIDRAKHGGAYEEELEEQLAFINNPPKEIAYRNKKGKLKWFTPDWMGYLKGKLVDGKTVKRTGSVLSRVHQYVSRWEEEELVAEVNRMRVEYKDNNILNNLVAGVEMPSNPIDQYNLRKAVGEVKGRYNVHVREAYNHFITGMKKAEFMNFVGPMEKNAYLEQVDKERKDLMNHAVDIAQAELTELAASFTPEQVGVVAYQSAYSLSEANRGATEDQPARGLSFPWVAAKYQLLSATRTAFGTQDKPNLEPKVKTFSKEELAINKVNIGNFAPGMTGKMVANMIQSWNDQVAVMVESDQVGNVMYNVYVKKDRVASIFPEYVTRFAGSTKFVAKVTDMKVNSKSLSFYVAALARY